MHNSRKRSKDNNEISNAPRMCIERMTFRPKVGKLEFSEAGHLETKSQLKLKRFKTDHENAYLQIECRNYKGLFQARSCDL